MANEEKPKIRVLQPTFGDTEEILRKFRDLFRSGQITMGKNTLELEGEVGEFLGVREVIAVSSCTAGMMMTLKAMDLSGEVILPSFTFAASAHVLIWCGLKPVFCDCEEDTLSLDPGKMEDLIHEGTAAIMPVYIFGAPPDWVPIQGIARARGIRLLADAAQGLGALYRNQKTGGFGDAEVFSLSPTKVVTSGEGGLVTTNDRDLARRIRGMRDYGKAPDGEDMNWVGLSARMSEFHAVIALENFRRLSEWTARRWELIELYRREIGQIPGIRFPKIRRGDSSSWNYMVILVERGKAPFSRDELFHYLKNKGIQTKRYFYPPVHRMKIYRVLLDGVPRLPITERIAESALALPLYSHMDDGTVADVCRSIQSFAQKR